MSAKSLRTYLLWSLSLHVVFVLGTYFSGKNPRLLMQEDPPLTLVWHEIQSPEKLIQGQIVDQEEQGIETPPPDHTKYLGRRNQTVAQETRAAQTGAFRNTPSANPAAATPTPTSETQPRQVAPAERPMESASQGFFPRTRETFRDMAQERILNPDDGRSLASQTNDHLENIAVSSETHLNTREFVYYTYFSRIKERILQHWEPSIKRRITQLIHQGRFVASVGDRTTHLFITLNEQGQLVRVQVKSPSGLRDLDDEAIKAFESAAPFPNPPESLVEKDGTIRLDWRFIIEV